MVERPADVQALTDNGVISKNSRVFVAGVAEESTEGPIVMGYQGSLSEPGGDVQIGADFFLQVHDYGTSEYLSLIGATIVRVTDEIDFAAFLDDADQAYAEGAFPDFATHPLVRLCDSSALGSVQTDLGPKLRVYVDAQGEVSTSPAGSPLGNTYSTLDELQQAWLNAKASGETCPVSLAAAVPDSSRREELESRPWIGIYHTALAGIREIRSRNLSDFDELRVSGFGGRMNADLEEVEAPADQNRFAAPALVYSDEQAFLFDLRTEKTFQLELAAAALAEQLLVLGSVDRAKEAGEDQQIDTVAAFFASAGVPLTA